MPTVAVIVVNWNTRDLLDRCLDSVARTMDDLEFETIVVDNGSTDGSLEMLADRFPSVRVIANSDNVGFGSANNQAVAITDAPYLLLLNSDAELTPGACRHLFELAEAESRVAIVGAYLVNPDRSFQATDARFPSLRQEFLILSGLGRLLFGSRYPNPAPKPICTPRITDWVAGACMFARRDAFLQVGGFDETYFMYGEEVDLCYRLHLAGWQMWTHPGAIVTHVGGGSNTVGPPTGTELHLYMGRVRFFRKHYGRLPTLLLRSQIYVMTLLKIPFHGLLRTVSQGRYGRNVVPFRELLAALREPLDTNGVERQPIEARGRRRPILPPSKDSPPPGGNRPTRPKTAVLVGQAHRTGATETTPGASPRIDYVEIANRLSADLLTPGPESALISGLTGWIHRSTRVSPYPSIAVIRRLPGYTTALSMSEREALPLAALLSSLRRPLVHVVIGHKLSTRAKRRLFRLWPLHQTISHLVCVCRSQADFATRELGFPASKVSFVFDSVDDIFFRPTESERQDYVLCVGQERRDYRTLLRAMAGTGFKLCIVASGGWTNVRVATSHRTDVEVLNSVSYARLRQLYAGARVVVVPLRDTDYAAGVNSLLEAMAMEKAVIVSRTLGIADYVSHGNNAVCVQPGEVEELRCAISSLWTCDDERTWLGSNARRTVEERHTLNAYVARIAHIVLDSIPERLTV